MKSLDEKVINPIFYVSSSAWNIFDFLTQFFDLRHFPKGPIFLRDLGLDQNKFIKTGHEHKLEKIRMIFSLYPNLPFILIGDSGQHDIYYYTKAAQESPSQVKLIFIREITKRKKELPPIPEGTHFHYFSKSSEIAKIAADLGYLKTEKV